MGKMGNRVPRNGNFIVACLRHHENEYGVIRYAFRSFVCLYIFNISVFLTS